MDKEFVTYKQALALEDLGFNEKCLAYFDYYGKIVELCLKDSDWDGCGQDAPLKQQVLRWFRQKHNLIGLIEGGYDSYKNVYSYVIWKGSNDDWLYYYWDSYEEAENACIDKLIEILKLNKL
jgi:hypothetical protein